MSKGKITRIIGPVIFAEGLRGAKKNHIVLVGEKELLGEIVQIKENTTIIQVYEETSSLSINEPIIDLKRPLTVRLGPGLLGGIFDGIQRPLERIKANFLETGVKETALPRNKQWHFIPQTKPGDKLHGGESLGILKETPLIDHNVLVPPQTSGQVKEIVTEGDYSIDDVIAKLETDEELFLYQDWPVRVPRPFRRRISTLRPFITGQRILDFFFPVVEGGTAIIPGGFGTGKCVTKETPVLLENGEIETIGDLYNFSIKNNGIIKKDTDEETLIKIKNRFNVLSFNGKGFAYKNVTHVYRGKTNTIIKIRTRSGRRIELTPAHKMYLFNGKTIVERRAKNIETGDYLVVPRKITTSLSKVKLDPYKIDQSLRVVDENALRKMVEVIDRLKENIILKKLAKHLDTSNSAFNGYYKRRRNPPLSFLTKLTDYAKIPLIQVKFLKAEHQSKPFKVPDRVTKELAEWLGLFIADGHIRGEYAGVLLYNNSEDILNRFKKLTVEVFNLTPKFKRDSEDRTPYMIIHSTALIKFLYYIGIPKKEKTHTVKIPNCVLKSSETVLAHFLNGYIAGDGWFTKYDVGFSTASEKLHIGLCYLLSRLGILFKNKIKKTNYDFSISGYRAEQLANNFISNKVFFYEKLQPLYDYAKKGKNHFDGFDILPMDKTILAKLKDQGKDEKGHDIFRKAENIRLHNYIDNNENITYSMVKRIHKLIEEYKPKIELEVLKTIEEIIGICDNVYFDKIVEIETIEKPTDVYDLTVEDLHNFIGGNAPLILHNTILERTLAKYSSTDIMVLTLCGERGNETVETLESFRTLEDPKTGHPMSERTCIIANTSNMPVAAREASIYSGITIAEFYRDMGYRVSMLADSTSRWAEALREISGRLEEIPGEEGYPSYLPKLIGQFYERGGSIETLCGSEGSLSIVGAVSPQAGDFSEPVTQYSLRVANALWALDTELARSRHYPAVNWHLSFTRYTREVILYMKDRIAKDWGETRQQLQEIMQTEEELERIVRLLGKDTLSESQKGLLQTAELIKEGFLQQNAFSEFDAFCSSEKTYQMAKTILTAHELIQQKVTNQNYMVEDLQQAPWIAEIKRMKERDLEGILHLRNQLLTQF